MQNMQETERGKEEMNVAPCEGRSSFEFNLVDKLEPRALGKLANQQANTRHRGYSHSTVHSVIAVEDILCVDE